MSKYLCDSFYCLVNLVNIRLRLCMRCSRSGSGRLCVFTKGSMNVFYVSGSYSPDIKLLVFIK